MTRRILGLTGGIGAGKSTAAAMFGALGATVVDVDAIGRGVGEVGGPAHEGLVRHFGGDIVRDGALHRPTLAARAFADPNALAALNAITHPAINGELARAVAAADPDAIVILDQAVLVESPVLGRWADGPEGGYGDVIVVETPLETRVARLVEHRGMTEEDARARIAGQVGDAERRAIARWVIDNAGDATQLEREVVQVWREVTTA